MLGPVLVTKNQWQELGLDTILGDCGRRKGRRGVSLAGRAFVLVANRLCSSGSEHHLVVWLETDYVCDCCGRWWLPRWEEHGRVQAHIFVAALAFLLQRALEKKLKAAGSKLSDEAALEALRTIHVVEMEVGPRHKQGVTGGNSRAREVLRALGIIAITWLYPP